jgi:hypothetical protein
MGDWRKRWARACLLAGFASQDPTTKKITVHKLRQCGTWPGRV